MKKIYNVAYLALGALAFIACSDDTDNPYAHENTITIQRSNLDFTAREGNGSVVFSSTAGNVTVKSNASWCTPTVSGDSVAVGVTQNNTLNGRSTTIVLYNGTDTLALAVTQRGVIAQFDESGIAVQTDETYSAKYAITRNIDLVVQRTPAWVDAVFDGDTLSVDVEANNTGIFRSGYVVYGSGDFVDSIKVFQADFDKDIAGSYKLYYETASGTLRHYNATVNSTGIKLNTSLTIPSTFDPATGTFSIESGSYVGRYKDKSETSYIYLSFGFGSNMWSSYYTGFNVTAPLTYDVTEGIVARFSGSVTGYEVESLILRCYSAQKMSEDTDQGTTLFTLIHPYLQRSI